MKTYSFNPSGWIEKNRKQYNERYDLLNWISETASSIANEQRSKLLSELNKRILYGSKDTKIDCRHLSLGCSLCGQGLWSCLFINGLCNCACFYCPCAQNNTDLPQTNTLTFTDPDQYVEYIKTFGFKGVSISGGEPFLTFERSLAFITAVKKHVRPEIYCWLYTNGTLVSKDKLEQLRDAGLNEIRFDIGAVGYDLKFAKQALKIIPTVTVEIPAIPEDKTILFQMIQEMSNIGINHLNLHQLRLTPFNFTKLVNHGYTFLHGEQVTVLESELTALEAILFAKKNRLSLAINYCSFHYKNSFQQSFARKRAAGLIKKSYEDITEKGFIRRITIQSDTNQIITLHKILLKHDVQRGLWNLSTTGTNLTCSAQCLKILTSTLKNIPSHYSIRYEEASIEDKLTYKHPFIEKKMPHKSVFVERRKVSNTFDLSLEELCLLADTHPEPVEYGTLSSKILPFESIRPGWIPYC